LCTNKTVFPQHALVVSDTYFQLSQAYEAHECALSWETSSRAWLANVRSIEMYNSVLPVPDSLGEPVSRLRGAHLNELHELCAQNILLNLFAMPEIANLKSKNVLHHSASIHLIPAGIELISSPLGLGILSPAHDDSVAYVRTGRCLIRPAATATLSSQHPTICAILLKQRQIDWVLRAVLDSGVQCVTKHCMRGSQSDSQGLVTLGFLGKEKPFQRFTTLCKPCFCFPMMCRASSYPLSADNLHSTLPGHDFVTQRGATVQKPKILKHMGASLLRLAAVGPAKHMTGILMCFSTTRQSRKTLCVSCTRRICL